MYIFDDYMCLLGKLLFLQFDKVVQTSRSCGIMSILTPFAFIRKPSSHIPIECSRKTAPL